METHTRRVILLINTGSPDSYEVADVRRYLRGFLTDPRILSMPRVLRHLLVKGIIAPFRAPRSAKKYKAIWWKEGAPLTILTERLAEKVQAISGIPTTTAMRYTPGSYTEALDWAEAIDATEMVAVPLFPHYAMSSYESAIAHLQDCYQAKPYSFTVTSVPPYFGHPLYIEAVVEPILKVVKPRSHLLFSYHGIPLSQTVPYLGIENQDYEWQCRRTTELVMAHPSIQALDLTYEVSFQSRFGNNRWLAPATKARLKALPQEGKECVAVVCPSFVCDCLETEEEIGVEGRETFLQAGGTSFTLVTCPNDSDLMVKAIIQLTQREQTTPLSPWTAPPKR